MHFGLLTLGLLSGGTAAIGAFNFGGGMLVAFLCYAVFGFGAVFLSAVIWAMAPMRQEMRAAPVAIPPILRPRALPDR